MKIISLIVLSGFALGILPANLMIGLAVSAWLCWVIR